MKKPEIQKNKSLMLHVSSFAIPLFIMLLCLCFIGAAPFGNNTLLFRDAIGQYIDFLSYMATIFSGENDMFYSFSKGMGGNFLGLAAYYLLSPFNILFALASYNDMCMLFDIIAIIKLAVCGLSFYYCSSRIYGSKAVLLAFSCAYALNGYNIVYIWNIMWLDGVMILPLICLGIYQIWKEDRYILYIASLIYALLTNYYIGYMLCICSLLMSLAMFVISEKDSIKRKTATFLKYLTASMIAGFFSSIVWLPAILSLENDRTSISASDFTLQSNFGIAGFASKFFNGAVNAEQVAGTLPNVFCSIAVIFLVILFFANNKISLKKRITAAAMLSIVFASMYINAFNNIWHGFSSPHGFNYRYSFVLSFLLVFVGQYSWIKVGTATKKQLIISSVFMLALFVLVKISRFEYINKLGMTISIVCFVLALLSAQFFKGLSHSAASLILALACVFDMGTNALLSLDIMTKNVGTVTVAHNNSVVAQSVPALEYIKDTDFGFYRTEKIPRRSHNDAMYFRYNGLTHFSSADRRYVMDYLGKMGLRNNDIWAYFNNGSTNEAESLLGVKYIIGGKDISTYKNYDKVYSSQGQVIYENKSVLPMAYISDTDIKTLSMDKDDLFSLHNDIWTAISGKEQILLTEEKNYDIILNNVSQSKNEDGDTVFTWLDDNQDASVIYEIEIQENMPLYFYFTAPKVQIANVYINGVDDGQYFWLYRWDMSNAGTFTPGEKVTIELVLRENELIVTQPYFYYENIEKLSTVAEEIGQQHTEITKIKSSLLKGHFTADKNTVLVFNIPYDEGWKLKIDGKKAETFMVMDALMATDISAGEHSFEIKFIPPGTTAALCLVSISILTSLIWFILKKQKTMVS